MILEELSVINKVDIPSADICIYSNGIMHIHIKVRNTFEISDSKEIVEARTALAQGKKHPVLYTTEHSFVTPSKEVNSYVASEQRSELVLADAFVIKSFSQRLAAKTYMLFKSPVRPTSFFSNEDAAIEWLKTFV
jgi:hypothetical protein